MQSLISLFKQAYARKLGLKIFLFFALINLLNLQIGLAQDQNDSQLPQVPATADDLRTKPSEKVDTFAPNFQTDTDTKKEILPTASTVVVGIPAQPVSQPVVSAPPVPAIVPAGEKPVAKTVVENVAAIQDKADEIKPVQPLQVQVAPVVAAGSEIPAPAATGTSVPRINRAKVADVKPAPPQKNLYAEEFFMPASQRLQYQTSDVHGFIFVKTPNRERNTQYSIVTNFDGGVIKTQYLYGVNTLEEAKKWIEEHVESATFEGAEIHHLQIPVASGKQKDLFWVGHKSYATADQAKSQIAGIKSVIETQKGNFGEQVKAAQAYVPVAEAAPPIAITQAQYQKEEELILKWADQLDLGEKLYGPFTGVPSGEPIIWQSFGETSWRLTNLEKTNYNAQVGYWTNRLVFKGIRAPLNTIDPYVESTIAMDSTGTDFASNLKLFAGLEWRPLQRNPWLYNFRPFGGIAILEWLRNWRLFVQYGDRKNLKDEFGGSFDYDLQYGAQIFYEWGIELPPLDQPPPSKFWEYVEQYVWGEYFGEYKWLKTDFSVNEYNGWSLVSSVIWGLKLPGIPLPENPINNELALMPYMRFEMTSSTVNSFAFQNRYFLAPGIRWMPFRNYKWKENEWLSKTKIFGEWLAVGRVQNTRQDGEAPYAIDYDLRFGVSFSNRRF